MSITSLSGAASDKEPELMLMEAGKRLVELIPFSVKP
ncbi:hypothetical protein CCACVL1_29841 [Corchorus capsularis]|uniref:Uncharacterized protein n=1 Tax=Corchorus capsularis TaxID=210143 RepID=A0A1R3FZT8_COCAP|nr:hypothetical protein CCACVL1_29841 [Corchorus capsularis]